MLISYLLAVLAALSNAGSNVFQRKANQQEPDERNLSPRLIWDLLHLKVWWAGLGFMIASFLCQASALGTGELAAAEPVIVLELPLTMVAGKLFLGSELHGREWGAIGLLTAGLAGLVGFLSPHGGSSTASAVNWAAGGGLTALVIGVLVVVGRRQRGQLRAGFLGAASGVTFGLTAAFMKAMTGALSHGAVHFLLSWAPYAMVAAGALGLFLVQSALQAGYLMAAQPGISLLDPFTAILWGVFVFNERTSGPLPLALTALSGVLMGVGAVVLSQSPVLQRAQQQSSPGQRKDGRAASPRGPSGLAQGLEEASPVSGVLGVDDRDGQAEVDQDPAPRL